METIWDEQNGTPDVAHRHGFYTVFSRNGQGTHTIDYNKYSINDHSLFFVSPGQVHAVESDSRPRGFVLLFSQEFLLNNGIELCFLNDLHLFHDYGETPPQLTPEQLHTLLM